MSLYYSLNLGSVGLDVFLSILFNKTISTPNAVGTVHNVKTMNTLESFNQYSDWCSQNDRLQLLGTIYFSTAVCLHRLRATLFHFWPSVMAVGRQCVRYHLPVCVIW